MIEQPRETPSRSEPHAPGAASPAPIRREPPRERLWRRGPTALADDDLLAILVGPRATTVLESTGGLVAASRASPRELAHVNGLGRANAARIAAAFELGRRAVDAEQHRRTVGRPGDVHAVVKARLAGLQQEVFLALGVDIRNGLLDVVEVARGTVNGVEVHPREVFRPLIRMAAAGAVLVHNHPSGDPTPSPHDVDLTRRLRVVGDVLGIPVIDHVVIGDASYRSIAEWLGPEL
jgi:DNA repair protein RadC